MDILAKMHWLEKSGQQQPLNSTITGEYWPVFINGRKKKLLHSNLRHTLYEEIYWNKMAKHREKKRDRMGHELSMWVNWEACEAAMKRLKIARRRWIAKHTERMAVRSRKVASHLAGARKRGLSEMLRI
jgi:hypothetical protein